MHVSQVYILLSVVLFQLLTDVVYLVIQFVENVVEQMATLIQELENVQEKRPVLDKRLPTKVSCIQYQVSLPT